MGVDVRRSVKTQGGREESDSHGENSEEIDIGGLGLRIRTAARFGSIVGGNGRRGPPFGWPAVKHR